MYFLFIWFARTQYFCHQAFYAINWFFTISLFCILCGVRYAPTHASWTKCWRFITNNNQSLASYFFATQIYSFYMQNILHKSSWCEKDWNARMTISIHFLQATLISITNWMSIEIRYVSLDLIGVDLWALQWSILKYIKRLYIITFFLKNRIAFLSWKCWLPNGREYDITFDNSWMFLIQRFYSSSND